MSATCDGDDVTFFAEHKSVMTDIKIRFRGTIHGDTFDGMLQTAGGPHPVTGERVG